MRIRLKEKIKRNIAIIIATAIFAVCGGVNIIAAGSGYLAILFSSKSISAGFYNAAAIKNDGSVWTWGFNEKGALGNTTFENSNVPTKLDGIENAASVDIDLYNTVVLTAGGDVYVAGDNSFGQFCGKDEENAPVKIDALSNIVSVQTSKYYIEENGEVLAEPYIVALDAEGNVYVWGANKRGILGTGSKDNILSEPVKIDALSSILKISASGGRIVALKDDGTVYYWGYKGTLSNCSGESADMFLSAPQKVEGLSGIVSVSAGGHVLALDRYGRVYGFGNGDNGQMCSQNSTAVPVEITELSALGVTEVYADYTYSLFETESGSIYGAGTGCSVFADKRYSNYEYPILISVPDNKAKISASGSILLTQTDDNTVYAQGDESSFGGFGAGKTIGLSKLPVQTALTDLKSDDAYVYLTDGKNAFKIKNDFLFDKNGDKLGGICQSFSGKVSLEAVSGEPGYVNVLFAVYEKETGTLAALKNAKVKIEGDAEKSLDIYISEFSSEKEYDVKLFMWDITAGYITPCFTKTFAY